MTTLIIILLVVAVVLYLGRGHISGLVGPRNTTTTDTTAGDGFVAPLDDTTDTTPDA